MPFLALIPLLTLRRGYEGGCIQYPSRTLPLKGEGKVVTFSLFSRNLTWTFRLCKGLLYKGERDQPTKSNSKARFFAEPVLSMIEGTQNDRQYFPVLQRKAQTLVVADRKVR